MVLTLSSMLPLGTEAPDFDLPTTVGNNVSLQDFSDNKLLVVIFMCNHCPYVVHVKDELINVAEDYKEKDVGFVGISSNDPDYETSDSFENMKKENYPFDYAFDESQKVAKKYKAMCTPDIYVFDQDRKLAYRGQLDDSRPGNGVPVTGSDLREAIDAVLDDKEMTSDQKPSSGCNIKWKPGNEPDYFN